MRPHNSVEKRKGTLIKQKKTGGWGQNTSGTEC